MEMDVRELEALYKELRVRRAILDPLFWLMKCTQTQDEQDPENPFKPFPQKYYLKLVLDYLTHSSVQKKFLPKSRTMLMSWTVSAWAAHFGFNHSGMCTVFQSADEDRAIHDVTYVKTLWERSEPELKARWPVPKPPDQQPAHEFKLRNKSRWVALTGNPEKIRSEHPTIVVYDEAAIWDEFETGLNVGVGSNPLHIIALSSAKPGYFADVCEGARPKPWPEYGAAVPHELKDLLKVWRACGFPDYELELAA
jgi:hypothetical protein